MKKKIIISVIIIFLISFIFFYFKDLNKQKVNKIDPEISNDISYESNIIKDVYYSSKDVRGNEYIIKATEGEIDYKNSNVIYLTNVNGFIKLVNSNDIEITSEYGKYNTENFNTIFSKNVIIDYLDNNIIGEYLDFSIKRNSMIMSREIVYTNSNNILKADAIEINIDTKDTKIYMFQGNKKVNIRSKQENGYNKKI